MRTVLTQELMVLVWVSAAELGLMDWCKVLMSPCEWQGVLCWSLCCCRCKGAFGLCYWLPLFVSAAWDIKAWYVVAMGQPLSVLSALSDCCALPSMG